MRSALVVVEVALAFVLLTGAGLLLRSFRNLLQVDAGFDAANAIAAGVPISEKRFPDPAQLTAYLREIVAAVEAVPGVREAELTSALPLEGWGYGMPYQIAGRPMVDRANRQGCFFKMVSPSYFHTLGNQPLTDMRTLERIKSENVASDRLQTALLGSFAGVAILLAAIGIYGVVSYAVAQRTHEIGIRAALGADAGSLLRLILRGGMALTAAGLAIGLAGSLAIATLMGNLLFGVGARDPATLAAVAAALASVALLACYLPARRAAKVDPMVALRYE